MKLLKNSIGLSAVALLLSATLLSCTSVDVNPKQQAAQPSTDVSILVFGDSGYHYDYLEAEDYEIVVTEESFKEKERRDWIEDKRPIDELAFSPMYRLPRNGSMITASGLEPVANAMQAYCAGAADCDFGVMLGDNIYPDGATANADGRDTQRFRDLFVTPFAGLGRRHDDFRIYSVLGNHDWRTSREGAMAQVQFLEQTRPFYMDGLFYRVQPPAAHGDVEVFAIDTEVLLSATTVYKATLADDASEVRSEKREKPLKWAVPQTDAERNMVAWLEDSLRSSKAHWKIVIGHHPLWSAAGSKFEQAHALRRLILPTLCRYADIYLAGHEHTMEVHTDDCSQTDAGALDPLPQIVSGSAAKMRPINSAFIRNQLASYPQLRTLYAKGLTWGFAHLSIEGDKATVKIIEVPTDGSGGSRVTFEQSFARRRQVAS
ncbi:metallophosphoesterase [Peristeroidobacter agariperforans]|uniref:metallophosphoesterase n=1 Tax=Peristeroidobacter agariperforans TaxID=268404 RepID=UPI001300AF66|nr:metallophosphoesterase [Peristeroidobacter agariperforans]